jgi:tetratricopeptide (TPR) repeat protein
MKIHSLALTLILSALPATSQSQAPAQPSPAEQKMAYAKKLIEKNPQSHQAYNEFAMALARRARETSDTSYYAQAAEALAKSLALSPDNFDARKAEVWILLGKHEFGAARDKALTLNKRAPDDVLVYGLLVDANAELGNYDEAEKAAQWMLDLRPGNVPGLTRGAYLRELFGDIDGALEFMQQAYEQTQPGEFEDRAWILTQMAHLYLAVGRLDLAENLLEQAQRTFPAYHYALANLARVRTEQQRYVEAVDLLRRRYQAAPHAENLYDLAEALEHAGRTKEAQEAYAQFEEKAGREMQIADNANRELVFYYIDHAHRPSDALRIARLEAARRHDVYTLDAFAWALHANGESAEARRQIEKALAVGIRDARFFYHAGEIALAMQDRDAAARYLKQSIDLNSHAECSAAARRALATLPPASPLALRRD